MFSVRTFIAAPGNIIRFFYPTVNQVGVQPQFRQRCVLVRDVRDTLIHPVSSLAFRKNPLRKRGRWLITGIDMDLGQERSFYWESVREHRKETFLRLGLYDPLDDSAPTQWIGWPFAPNCEDRLYLADLIRQYNDESGDDLLDNLGVYPVVD